MCSLPEVKPGYKIEFFLYIKNHFETKAAHEETYKQPHKGITRAIYTTCNLGGESKL